jgi:PAS domain S-box-containing protein
MWGLRMRPQSTTARPVRAGDARFFALSLDLLTVAGFDGYLKRVNPAWERVSGYSAEELTSRPYLEFIHPDDRERTAAEAARLANPGAETVDFELRLVTRQGEERWILFSAQGAQEEEAIYAVGKDITERKLAEAHLAAQHAVEKTLLESETIEQAAPRLLAGLGVAMGWETGTFWVLNPDADELVCTAFWSADPERTARFEQARRALRLGRGEGVPGHALATSRPVWVLDISRERDFIHPELATEANLHAAMGMPILSGGGLALGALDFFSSSLRPPDDRLLDMTSTISAHIGHFMRRREAEQSLAAAAVELRRRAGELERSNAELEQFAYVASHDLSEPLRAIRGFVDLLQKRYGDQLVGDAEEFMGFIRQGVDQMQTLIDDLLAYSRVARDVDADDTADAAAALEAARSALAPTIARCGARVQVGDLPTVRSSNSELTQLFQNLLSNALKFCDDDTPLVEVSAERQDADRWHFVVADNGIGIDPRFAERVFKMFQRLHGRDAYEGTGIGLAICKRIVERRGGEIWVQARQQGGSAFHFTLPGASG